jgi:phage tail tape-measure protein
MTHTITKERAADEAPVRVARRDEQDLILGRPVEDRGFEAVEAGMGFAAGLAIGTAVAGPIGAVVGSLVGLTGGIAAGEALERHIGLAATTTDAASDREPPDTL